ncbi:MAG: DnaJ domain-containing protein [Parvularculaceae bacterium]
MAGFFALILAVAAAGWLAWRAARGNAGGEGRSVFLLKLVVWLGIAAALFAAKLMPLALMVLLAAGGVTAIEIWRERQIKIDETTAPPPPAPAKGGALAPEEAAAVLGVAIDAGAADIKAAHRKLISQLHPDKGGTDYLAAKINEARKILLARNDPPPQL